MCLLCAITGVWLTQGRQQHLHPDRVPGADRPRVQERDPDRRVRARAPAAGPLAGGGGARGLPHPAPADPHDVVRVHHGRAAAGVLQRRRRRDAPRDGRGGVLRHARRHVLRPGAHAGVLRGDPAHRRTPPPGATAVPPSSRPGRRSMRKPTLSRMFLAAGLAACASAPAYRSSDVPVPRGLPRIDGRHHPVPGGADAASVPPFDSTRAPAPGPDPPVSDSRAARDSRPRRPAAVDGVPADQSAYWRTLGDYDARPADRRGAPGQSRRARRGGAGAGGAGGAHRGGARLRADRHGRRRLHPPAAVERDVPDRRRRRVPRPGHLGRRLRRVVGAGPVRPGAAERPGAGRARRRGERGPARRAGHLSRPRWPARTSSCAARRSGSAWRAATPTTSAAPSR